MQNAAQLQCDSIVSPQLRLQATHPPISPIIKLLASDERRPFNEGAIQDRPQSTERGATPLVRDMYALENGAYPAQNGWRTYELIRSVVDNADRSGVRLTRRFEATAADCLKNACENSINRLQTERRRVAVRSLEAFREGRPHSLIELGREDFALATSIGVYEKCLRELTSGMPCLPPSTRVIRAGLRTLAALGFYAAPWVTLEQVWSDLPTTTPEGQTDTRTITSS